MFMNLSANNEIAIKNQIAEEYLQHVYNAYANGSDKAKRLIDLVTDYHFSCKHPDSLIREAREINDLLAEVIGMK